ncbi:hypothetical protein JCM10296v2_002211 [Rhodotorula toruloides]
MAATDSTPPSAAILAEQQVLLLKARSAVLSLLFAVVFYGIAVSLAVCYLRRSSGQIYEPLFVRAYVWTTLASGAACLAIQATVLYQDLTTLVTMEQLSSSRLTVPQTLEAWFAVEVKVYYVYRAVRVTKHRPLQALAILLGLGTICGFFGRAIVAVRIRLGAAIPPRQAVAWSLASAWTFAADGLLCASILVYELVYKRRATLVRSSLMQHFTAVAVSSSVALLPLDFSRALMYAVAYTQKPVYMQTSFAMSRIFPFVSCCIVFTCLLERPSLDTRHVHATVPNILGTRTSGTKQSISQPFLHDRPSQRFYDVAVLYAEHSPSRVDGGMQEATGEPVVLYDEELGTSEQSPQPFGPGASARVSRAARDERKSSDETKDEDEAEEISLRGFLAQSLV